MTNETKKAINDRAWEIGEWAGAIMKETDAEKNFSDPAYIREKVDLIEIFLNGIKRLLEVDK